MAGYSEASGGDQLNMQIEITTDRNFKNTLMINQRNALVQQRLDVCCCVVKKLVSAQKRSTSNNFELLDMDKFLFVKKNLFEKQ